MGDTRIKTSPLQTDSFTWRLLQAVDPENIRLDGPRWEIALWTEWKEMLSTLVHLGPMWVTTRNPHAALTQRGVYQGLSFSDDYLHAHSPSGSLDIDFHPWVSAALVAEEQHERFAHYVEFRGLEGEVLHRVELTENSHRDELIGWVHFHQAVGCPPASLSFIPPRRWHTVQQRHWLDYEDTEAVSKGALISLLRKAASRNLSIGVIVGNDGAVQSAGMTPTFVDSLSDSVILAGDESSRLRCDLSAIDDVVIHHRRPHGCTCGSSVAILKCFNDEGALSLAVMAPDLEQSDEWNAFMTEIL